MDNYKQSAQAAEGALASDTLAAKKVFGRHYSQKIGVLAGYLPKESKYVASWLSGIVKEALAASEGKSAEDLQPAVLAMAELLEHHNELRDLVRLMIAEGQDVHWQYEPDTTYTVNSIETMLYAMNHIIMRAPPFTPDVPHSAFPMSGLFVYMMWTRGGERVFKDDQFNAKLADILDAWCTYLDSPASLNVITTGAEGWLNEKSYTKNDLDQFVSKQQQRDDPVHWGYTSFNDFFHRQIIANTRPIDGVSKPTVVTSANDGTVYRIAREVKRTDCFDCKSQNYSLESMLDGHHVDRFVGGDLVQSFLSGNNYHRWWAPISGTVIETRVVPGFMFSELYGEGFDDSAGTQSQGYEANVNTRGLVFIESDDPSIGMVCVMPIGITEISSVDIQVNVGDKVKKGQELGWFSYGGSSMCLIFQPGAIKQFTIVNPLPDSDSDNGPFIRVGGQIAITNTR